MKAAHRRLDKVEASLTPKQQVLRWLDQVFSFASEDEYLRWQATRPTSDLPRVRIPESVAWAVRKAMRGQPEDAVERAVLAAVRDVYFLTKLVFDVNTLVNDKAEMLELRAALCARGLQLLLMEHAPRRGGKSAFVLPEARSRVLDVREEIELLLDAIYRLQGAVEIISRRHFDGRPVLFPKRAARLGQAPGMAEAVAREYNGFVARAAEAMGTRRAPAGRRPGAGGPDHEDLLLDAGAIQEASKPGAARAAEYCVDLAKADALESTGCREPTAHLLTVRAGLA